MPAAFTHSLKFITRSCSPPTPTNSHHWRNVNTASGRSSGLGCASVKVMVLSPVLLIYGSFRPKVTAVAGRRDLRRGAVNDGAEPVLPLDHGSALFKPILIPVISLLDLALRDVPHKSLTDMSANAALAQSCSEGSTGSRPTAWRSLWRSPQRWRRGDGAARRVRG